MPVLRGGAYAAVIAFVHDSIPQMRSGVVDQHTRLIGNGLDSLAVLDFINLMAAQYGIELDDDDFESDNFETVGALVGLVERKLAS